MGLATQGYKQHRLTTTPSDTKTFCFLTLQHCSLLAKKLWYQNRECLCTTNTPLDCKLRQFGLLMPLSQQVKKVDRWVLWHTTLIPALETEASTSLLCLKPAWSI